MILRQTRAVTVTDPPSAGDQLLIVEYDALAAMPDRTPEQAARMEQIAKELAPAEQLQIELCTINTVQYGQYEANRRQVVTFAEQQTGQKWQQAIEDPAAASIIDAALMWARISAAVTRVQSREASRVDEQTAGAWADVDAAWLSSPAAWMEQIPHDLADALDRVCFALNPGLFRQIGGTDAKKNGGISVG